MSDVSVVIPCFRCASTIARAVESVADQTSRPYEVILVDDCSRDETLDKLHELRGLYPDGWIKVVSLRVNSGAGVARNAGWKIAACKYVAFLDADDSWHPNKIESQYGWMVEHPEVALTGHDNRLIGFNGRPGECFKESGSPKFFFVGKWRIFLSNWFPTSSVMLLRDIPQRFVDGKRYAEDYQLWMEICCAGLKCYWFNAPLVFYYKAAYGESGLSASLWRMEKGELAAYVYLFRKGFLGVWLLAPLMAWSMIRFLRRIFKVSF